jgi:IS4 transposase
MKTSKLYPKPLRLVEYRDLDSGENLRFITNNFDISALEVANIYRNRWQIEVFFKWVKQNIVIKTLWGYSENAVKTHLWVAICAYLIVARIKAAYNSPYSTTEILSILHVSALEKTSLKELLSPPESLIQNHDVNEPNLFD